MKRLTVLLCLLFAAHAGAQPPAAAAATEREIQGLFAALGDSGCRFQRNGSWYDAATARAHLQRKYTALRKRGTVGSAERFIDLAATRSSMTGTPYAVRCGEAPPVASRTWFLARLAALRAATRR